jgi:hypothetical protein
MIRADGNDLYIMTNPWQEDNKYFYAIAMVIGNRIGGVYVADAQFTSVKDFGLDGNGLMYFIERNEGLGGTFLRAVNLYDTADVRTLHALPSGSSALTVSGDGVVYIANADSGIIQAYRNGTLEFFSGIEGERAFIDGISPRFYSPQRLEYNNGYLYVWDFNTLRRIEAVNGVAGECITIAGMASPDFKLELDAGVDAAEDVILPFGSLMDFTVIGNGILLTDHKRGAVWRVE